MHSSEIKQSVLNSPSGQNDNKKILAKRYRVEKKLGSGNYGTAFLVTDLKNNEL